MLSKSLKMTNDSNLDELGTHPVFANISVYCDSKDVLLRISFVSPILLLRNYPLLPVKFPHYTVFVHFIVI